MTKDLIEQITEWRHELSRSGWLAHEALQVAEFLDEVERLQTENARLRAERNEARATLVRERELQRLAPRAEQARELGNAIDHCGYFMEGPIKQKVMLAARRVRVDLSNAGLLAASPVPPTAPELPLPTQDVYYPEVAGVVTEYARAIDAKAPDICWLHIKTGGEYTVIGQCRIEATNTPRHRLPQQGWRSLGSTERRVFFDGRFERIAPPREQEGE